MLSYICELTDGNNFRSATNDEMINRLKNQMPTYEATGSADNITRLYFDVDYKLVYHNEFYDDVWSDDIDKIIGKYGEDAIRNCLTQIFQVEPVITVATSSKEEYKKYSWRYFVSNIKMKKYEMKSLVNDLNIYVMKTTDIRDYLSFMDQTQFFDTSVYDLNRKMRCVGTSKKGEDRPLVLVKGNLEDTLITAGTETAQLIEYVKEKPKIKVPTSPTSIADTSILNTDATSELISLVGNKGWKRDDWLKICSWFVSHSTKDAFLAFVDAEWRDDAEKLFDDFAKNPKPCSPYTLDKLAKIKDDNAYKAWRNKHNKFIGIERLEKGSNDVAMYVAPRLKENLIYCDDKWIQFDRNTCLWRIVKKPDALVITFIQKEIDEERESILAKKNKSEDDEERKILGGLERQLLSFHKEVSNGSYVSQILKFLTDYLFDADFINLLDNHKGFIAFKNGMLDLKTGIFRPNLLQSDYLTKTVPYNYVAKNDTDADVIDVRTALKKICNWNDAHLDYYLSSIGYALLGDANKEQLFWYFRGQTAENGKSVILESLEKIMPNYVIKGTPMMLDKNAELKKEVPTWKCKRIVWVNELSTKQKDEDIVKSVCDGTDFKYNHNYAEEARKVPITFKLFAVSNNSLNIKGDSGILRRFRLCQFNSQFQEATQEDHFENLQFKRDKNFGDNLCGIYRDALLHLIFKYSKMYCEEKQLKPYPAEWNEDARENIAENNKFQEWFENVIDVGVGFECWKCDFEAHLPTELKNIKIKDELTRMKIAYKYDSQQRGTKEHKGKKGIYIGFKIREEETDEIDTY